ncbi:MAG TPA: ABC transporter permease subunit [Motilibacteraceae bacterium]|nr:ABC transporter permease subunit [Motilibacteraceae bacterium]
MTTTLPQAATATSPGPGRRRLLPRTRAGRLPRSLRTGLLLAPALLVVVVLFLGGLALGALQSFGYQPFLPGWHWTLSSYTGLWHDPAVRASLFLTLRVSVLATAVSATLAVACALLIRRTRRGRNLLTVLFQSTLPVPHVVGAVAMLLLLGQSGFLARLLHLVGLVGAPASAPALVTDGFGWGILAEYVWKETPFIGVVVLAALSRGVDELEDVGRVLGASAWQRFRSITLPLVAPAVLAGSVIVFAFAFGSYEVPYLLGRTYPATLPVVAYQRFTDSDLTARPEAMAISMVVALVATVLVLAYVRLTESLLGRRS